jgi:hypothetical protein
MFNTLAERETEPSNDQENSSAPDKGDVDILAVLTALDGIPNLNEDNNDDDDEDDEEFWESPYDRTAYIRFPEEVERTFGVYAVTVPVRDILDLCASRTYEERANKIRAIRDGFFSGDSYEDYGDSMFSQSVSEEISTAEERARARIDLQRSASERAARRAEIERERFEEGGINALFSEEFRQCDAVEDELYWRSERLDEEWEKFVLATESLDQPGSAELTRWREDLMRRTTQFVEDREAATLHRYILKNKAREDCGQRHGC